MRSAAERRQRSDRRFFRRIATAALILQSLPYVSLWAVRPAGSTYTGALFSPVDTYRYYDVMLHSHEGAWTFANYFTYVPHPAIAIFTIYTLLGKLIPGDPVPLSLALVFHVARLGLCLLLIQQAWRLFGEALPSRAARRTAMVFLLFTSGLGVLVVMLNLSGLRVLGGDQPWDLFFQESSAAFGLAMIHTEKVGIIAVMSLAYLVWVLVFRRRSRRVYTRQAVQVALMIAAAVPYLAYAYGLTVSDPTIRDILNQATPNASGDPIVYYALGLGIPRLCAAWGLPRVLRHPAQARPGEVLLWSLALGGLVVMVLPWQTIQHRGEGLQIAIAGLAGQELVHSILPRLWRRRGFRVVAARRLGGYGRRRLRLLSVNLVLILSSTSVMALSIGGTRAGAAIGAQLYLNRDDPDALAWLQSHWSSADVVVAAPDTLPFIAAYSGTHAVWGDFAYTPNYDAEGRHLAAFLTGTESPRPYLRSRNVTWVYFGPREKEHPGLDPGSLDFLSVAHRSGDTVIYRVAG